MEKVGQIRKWLLREGFDGVLLGRRDNYTWISQGAMNHVVTCSENGVAYYAITQERIELIADSSDSLRVAREQNPLEGNAIMVPWYEPMEQYLQTYINNRRFVSDTGIAGTRCVQDQLVDLRMQLSENEVKRYEEVGRICARLVEGVCKSAKPGQTEQEIAALIKCRCIEQGISPDCVLVGADERIQIYRHPMPTDKRIEKSLMAVLGGQKYGLYISMTRMVYFGEVPEEISERYKKTQYVFACMQTMMQQGMSYGSYFERVKLLYKEAGYDGEWKYHHQGGPTGYGCREFVVNAGNEKRIQEGQAYAWNPTIQGTKCEETTFLGNGTIKTFTNTGEWPRTEVITPDGTFAAANIYCVK